jgi:U3 small nucleolar RNA-associated protein 14
LAHRALKRVRLLHAVSILCLALCIHACRNTSRWARRALKRGATIIDENTKAAVAEQLRMGEALRRKIEGGRGGSDSDDDEYDDAGSDRYEGYACRFT